jgi:hypothetical protein
MTPFFQRFVAFSFLICLAAGAIYAQPDRIRASVDTTQSTVLQGSVHAGALAENDRGVVVTPL